MTRKRKSGSDRKLPVNNLNNQILRHLSANPSKKYNAKQIIDKLGINNTRDQVHHLLVELEKKNLIIHNKEGKYHWNKANTVKNESDVSHPVGSQSTRSLFSFITSWIPKLFRAD